MHGDPAVSGPNDPANHLEERARAGAVQERHAAEQVQREAARRAVRPESDLQDLVSTVVSLPLNLNAMWLELQVSSWRDVLEGIPRAELWENLFDADTGADDVQ